MEYRLLSNNNDYEPTHHHWLPSLCIESDSASSVGYAPGRPGSYLPLQSEPGAGDYGLFTPPGLRSATEPPTPTRSLGTEPSTPTRSLGTEPSTPTRSLGTEPPTPTRSSGPEPSELEPLTPPTIDNDRHVELAFFNNNYSWNKVCVEMNLRIADLCELLKVKRNVSGTSWSIVEAWPRLGIERTLEDHEDILAVHKEMQKFNSKQERKFHFRQDFLKYEPFVCPRQFFTADMVRFPKEVERRAPDIYGDPIREFLMDKPSKSPKVYSSVWMRQDNCWRHTKMTLYDRKLYVVRTNNRPWSEQTPPPDYSCPLLHLGDYEIYRIDNAKESFNAPFKFGICLRPSSKAEAEDVQRGIPGLRVVIFTSEAARSCWLSAMRLAKYGKQLRENYRAFRNKQCEQNNTKEQYSSYHVSNESLRSRVAMDFSGSTGRIVEDPQEARDIARSADRSWGNRLRTFSRSPPSCGLVKLDGLHNAIHTIQPWFHSGLTRDHAASIVKEHGTVDGVFLVRESISNTGSFVLTYKHNDKVFHTQIAPIFDERRNCMLYSLDQGTTKFYDLLQLVEFYQLNSGSLPTRLTHYVQQRVPEAPPLPSIGTPTSQDLPGNTRSNTDGPSTPASI